MTPEPRLTRSEQRDAAREKARQLREANKRKAKTRKAITFTAIIASAAIIIGLGAVAVISGIQKQQAIPNSGTPANMTFDDGIKIGTGLKAFTSTTTPTPDPAASIDPATIPNIVMYVDYQCPVCQAFEVANSSQIRSWVESGAATVEIHPISFLDGSSANAYSSRAANAALCVANYEPDSYFDFSSYLFESQPAEQTAGPDNAALIAGIKSVGVTNSNIDSCVNDNYFGSWLTTATKNSMSNNIPLTDSPVKGTPTVLVNGIKYEWQTGDELTSAARFAQFVQQAVAQ